VTGECRRSALDELHAAGESSLEFVYGAFLFRDRELPEFPDAAGGIEPDAVVVQYVRSVRREERVAQQNDLGGRASGHSVGDQLGDRVPETFHRVRKPVLGGGDVVAAPHGVRTFLDGRDPGSEAIGHQTGETEIVPTHGQQDEIGLGTHEVRLRADGYLALVGVVLRPGPPAVALLEVVVDR